MYNLRRKFEHLFSLTQEEEHQIWEINGELWLAPISSTKVVDGVQKFQFLARFGCIHKKSVYVCMQKGTWFSAKPWRATQIGCVYNNFWLVRNQPKTWHEPRRKRGNRQPFAVTRQDQWQVTEGPFYPVHKETEYWHPSFVTRQSGTFNQTSRGNWELTTSISCVK